MLQLNLKQLSAPEAYQLLYEGLEARKSHLESQIRYLEYQLDRPKRGRPAKNSDSDGNLRKPRQFTAQSRKNIADAQKRRWRKHRAQKTAD
jgi:hypothetical protein